MLALPDLAENTGIAVKQLAIAAGILLVSIGSLERVVAALGLTRADSA